MDMGRRFIHVQMSGEHTQCVVSRLEAVDIHFQTLPGEVCRFRADTGIILVPDLQHNLVKGLLLLGGTDFRVIVRYTAVTACLFCIVALLRCVKQFMVHRSDIFLTEFHVQMAAGRVYIGGVKRTAVMIEGAFPNHSADRPFQNLSFLRRKPAGSVTLAKSNAKALLTLRIKSAFAPCGATWLKKQSPVFKKAR